MTQFYKARGFEPLWLGAEQEAWRGRELIETIRSSDEDALDPAAYEVDPLDRRLERAPRQDVDGEARLDLELDLTEAFLALAGDMAQGRVAPSTVDAQWEDRPAEEPLLRALEAAAAAGPARAIEELRPQERPYRELRDAYLRYRALAEEGGWKPLGSEETLSPGDPVDPELLRALTARLAAEDFLPSTAVPSAPVGRQAPAQGEASAGRQSPAGGQGPAADPPRYEGEVVRAIERFQRTRGIETDGILGPETRRELDVSAVERARQIGYNLERWRWLPLRLDPDHVRVNVPAFDLVVVRDGARSLHMASVVGRERFTTPLLSDQIETIVVNPYWNVPESIARDEILPKVVEDPDYLARNQMEVLASWDSEETIDPDQIDWDEIDPDAFEYRIRQRPGPHNALGRIKFLFPNHFAVYLHDTPEDQLFSHTDRAFSHGCVRVEKPVALAVELLRGDPEWDERRLREAIAAEERVAIPLPEPIPVHLVYWTAFVNDDGEVEFHQDLYGIDRELARVFDPLGAGGPAELAARGE